MTTQAKKDTTSFDGLRRLFTRKEFYAMADAGILSETDRVELLKGVIFSMAPIGNRHAACVDRVANDVGVRVQPDAIFRVQSPLTLDDDTELQPDFMLLAPRQDHYDFGHPGPEDVLLLVEVADSSVGYDRQTKVPQYAAAGIAEVWLVDLETDQVESHSEPSPEGYRSVRRHIHGETLAPIALPDLAVEVTRILPARSQAEN